MKIHTIFLAFLLLAEPLPAQIIISEVMFDPLFDENSDEFIELYNLSPQDSVELAGLLIGDQNSVEPIVALRGGTILPPLHYAVVLDRDYELRSTTYDSLLPAQAILLTVDDATLGSRGLSNSKAETVLLLTATGDTLAAYRYSTGNAHGFSDEKIEPGAGDEPQNWRDSIVLHGTPGKRNSVTPFQRDLALSVDTLALRPEYPRAGQEFSVWLRVENAGREPSPQTEVRLSAHGSVLAAQPVRPLAAGEERLLLVPLRLEQPGAVQIRAELIWPEDEQPDNNQLVLPLFLGWPEYSVVINEIMHSPSSGQPEWVELYNRTDQPVPLSGWQLQDSGARRAIAQEVYDLAPRGFALLTADSTLEDFFSLPGEVPVMVLPGFPALNNSSDAVVLRDAGGARIDSMRYAPGRNTEPGLSLERRNPDGPSTDAGNWGNAVNAQGATPGRRNSIYSVTPPEQISLRVIPELFSPDGDGIDEHVSIEYTLPGPEYRVRLFIYDMRGRKVREMLNNAASGTRRSLRWDGRDAQGRLLPAGIYVLYLEAIDARAGTLNKATATTVLARRP